MKKQILLAVDDSVHSKNAVRYAVDMTRSIRELHFTLLHIQPRPSGYLVDEARTSHRAKTALESLRRKHDEAARACLKIFEAEMAEMGADPARIQCRTRPPKLGMARDILDFAQEGQFDAIAMGRRGVGRVTEMFMGSVTKKVLEYSRVVPVWIVDGTVESRRVLVAVDGSESARRAVDHAAFMLSETRDAFVTLLHVAPRIDGSCRIDLSDLEADLEEIVGEGSRRCAEGFLADAVETFRKAGLPDHRIEARRIGKSTGVARAIEAEVEEGRYGTVVVGRRGADRAFYMGSVSNYLLDRASNRAVWLVS
jgi:nucleotide-binding universal stress UspA family protein